MTAPKNHIEENKPQMSLMPLDLLRDFLEPAYREGLIKYHRESWREGFTISVMMDAALRHLTDFFYGCKDYDFDSEKLGIKKHHLGAALFCVLCMCDTVQNHRELDDRRKMVEEPDATTFNIWWKKVSEYENNSPTLPSARKPHGPTPSNENI